MASSNCHSAVGLASKSSWVGNKDPVLNSTARPKSSLNWDIAASGENRALGVSAGGKCGSGQVTTSMGWIGNSLIVTYQQCQESPWGLKPETLPAKSSIPES